MIRFARSHSRWFAVALAALPACAGPIGVGVRGGLPLNAPLDTLSGPPVDLVYGVPALPFRGFRLISPRYLVGPTVEVRLPKQFGVSVDALYQPIEFESAEAIINTPSSGAWAVRATTRGEHWEFPLLFRYHFRWSVFRPFVAAGAALSHVRNAEANQTFYRRGLFDRETYITSFTERSFVPGFVHRNTGAFVAGGGLQFYAHRLRFTPEFRYSRWPRPHFDGTNLHGFVRTPENQWQFLLGITVTP
jgi:hypothetical protein